jgi:hypothetical protein
MTNLIKWRNFTDVFPSWNFYLFSFFLFLFFLFLFSFFLFKLYPKICKLKLNHIIHHFLNLIFNFRQYCLLDFFHLGFILWTSLILPLFSMFLNILLEDHDSFCRATSWIIFLKFIFLS